MAGCEGIINSEMTDVLITFDITTFIIDASLHTCHEYHAITMQEVMNLSTTSNISCLDFQSSHTFRKFA